MVDVCGGGDDKGEDDDENKLQIPFSFYFSLLNCISECCIVFQSVELYFRVLYCISEC